MNASDPPRAGRAVPAWSKKSVVAIQVVLFLATLFGSMAASERIEQGSGLALLFALLPVPAFAWLIWSYIRGVRSMDELERRLQLEALALAFPCSLLIAFTAGLLDRAGFHGTGDWDLPRLWPLLLMPYFFGLWRARVRYT